MERENFGSRLGFLLISAGCAIGIGNVWKFPYITGQNGGGAFVLVYLLFLAILGVPVMTMEFAMGRASQKSPVRMYQVLAPKKKIWHVHGYVALIGCVILMMFYTTVAGWMLQYFVLSATGKYEGMDTEAIGGLFNDVLANPTTEVAYMAIIVVLGFFVISRGLQKGLENVSKVMMLALLAIMVILAINSCFLKGGTEGLSFYLLPDFSRMMEIGIGNVAVAAMNQAFFTLSLGVGAMAIFGSYIGKDRSLTGESVQVALLDTFVAIVSGLIIFPACFAYGVEPGAGPGLIFITLPNIFNHMPLGRLWGSLFFVFMTFAAFSTVLAVFECILACVMDMWGMSRGKASFVCCIAILLLSLPCALGYNVLSGFAPMGAGSTVLDLEDFIVSNLLLPIGSLIFVLFCVLRYGWGWDNFLKEANQGKGLKMAGFLRPYMTVVLPLIILGILYLGLR